MNTDDYEGHTPGPWATEVQPHGYKKGMEARPEPLYDDADVRKRLETLVLTTSFSQDRRGCGYAHHIYIRFPEPAHNEADWERVSVATATLIAAAPDLLAWRLRAEQTLEVVLELFEYFNEIDGDNEFDNPWKSLYDEIEGLLA